MKTLILVAMLSTCAMATDNCYIFERGSDSWATCKENAADRQAMLDRWEQRSQAMMVDSEATRAANSQAETNRLLRQMATDQRAKDYKEGE
jgi:hypothetical protein